MFALVGDVGSYADFLPWCAESVVDSDSGEQVRATLRLGHGGISTSVTTLNRNLPPRSIEMTLVEGPFKRFEGKWSFASLGDAGSEVELELDFEFANRMYARLLGALLDRVLSSSLDAFVERARKVYG